MAMSATLLLRRPDVFSLNPSSGLQLSQFACLRDFSASRACANLPQRSRATFKCTAGGGHDTAHHPHGLPQAHITALDNRAGGEELLALLRTKQPGKWLARLLAEPDQSVQFPCKS